MVTHPFNASSRSFKLTYIGLLGLVAATGLAACKSKPKSAPASASASVSAAATPAIPSAILQRALIVPKGPAFAIVGGQGIGPVRFGATVATIERLMAAKCEELTDKYCRYVGDGIEYELTNGVVSGMIVYRHGRPVPGSPGKTWGRTRCAIPPDVTPRVILSYARSVLGQPLASESVTTDNPNDTVLRETYQGLVLEYDRGEHLGETILGSIRVTKPDAPLPK